MAFNLADMVNNRKPVETENISDTVYRDVFELEPSKENFYSTDPERLQGLKNSILLFGVMQDVLIEDVDGKDRIISGHCRTMCCRMLVEEGHEEFRKINCKYTKVTLNTEKLPEDKDEKVEQLLNKLGIIQANRFREKTDWEKMKEALITEEVIKELRDLVDLQGTTRKMVQATLGTSGTQLERYHAIQKKLSPELMQEFQKAKINISVARELADLDEPYQKEALELYKKNDAITLPEVKTLKEKQELNRQLPGQLTLAEATGKYRPPEDDTVIDVDVQIDRFFESLKRSTTERIQKRDKNMSIYMISTLYDGVRIRNGHLNYQGKKDGILFNPDSDEEKLITWQQLAETLIEKYGKKQKSVKMAPLVDSQKGCPYYREDEVFTPDIARMIKIFLEDVYDKMYVGACCRFRAMGIEFAAVQRGKEKDFVFYDEKGGKVCYVSKKRMESEYQERVKKEEPDLPETQPNEVMETLEEINNSWSEWKPEEAVKELCTRYPELLKGIMQICRKYKNNGERAQEIQKKYAHYGYHSQAGDGFSYTFEGFSRGISIKSNTEKKEIRMRYGRLVVELLNIYNPYSSEFDTSGENLEMSDSDKCKHCENAAENKKIADEKQQIIELIPEAWPPELKDIPVPSMIVMDDILQDAEEDLKNYLSVADQGIPGRTILKYQLIAGGLRMIKNLVRDCLDDENIDDGKNVMEQLPLPMMRNIDQRKDWLRNYKAWGLWYTDEHIGVRYYKYDFANGARLIAEEYDPDTVHSQWVSDHTESYYMHLIGGPEPERKSGIPKWTQHGRYNKFPNSESELVEFLKEVQRESK